MNQHIKHKRNLIIKSELKPEEKYNLLLDLRQKVLDSGNYNFDEIRTFIPPEAFFERDIREVS